MKLIVQIPCFNEEASLPAVLAGIPRHVEGFTNVEVLVVDDGSTDRTSEVAREHGADHVVRHTRNQGLARSFRTGLDRSLALGADVIVNTDGDNQYAGSDISRLVRPILAGTADIVVGDRQTGSIEHFTPVKKKLQALGSWAVRRLSGTPVPDAVSGFRAISRDAALHLNIVSRFSYTIEMLIQAGSKQLAIVSIPVGTNPSTRTSRLARSTPHFVSRSLSTMVRIFSMYSPLVTFFYIGVALLVAGAIPVVRFIYFYATGEGAGHVQSLVIGGMLAIMGFMTLMIGLLADLINFNRQLLETTLEKVRRIELSAEQAEAAPEAATQSRAGTR
ncbi:MAG: glycosyltransferase family 2 protein [Gemmatimonadota bacterium]